MVTGTKRNGTKVEEQVKSVADVPVGREIVAAEIMPPAATEQAVPPSSLEADNLFAALSKAQGMVTKVGLDRRNTHHKYKYASAEALIAEGSAALSACGLALVPISQGLVNDGRDLRRQFLLVHRGGDKLPLEVVCPVFEERGRPLDKAMWGAATQSLGYLLRDLLLMPRVDEKDEPDARGEHEPPEERPARGRAAAAPAPAPAATAPTATPSIGVTAKPGKATADQLARMVRAKKDWFAVAGLSEDDFRRAWSAEVGRFGIEKATDLLPAQADDLLAQVAGTISRLHAEREVDRQTALDREDAMARAADATAAVNAANKGDILF